MNPERRPQEGATGQRLRKLAIRRSGQGSSAAGGQRGAAVYAPRPLRAAGFPPAAPPVAPRAPAPRAAVYAPMPLRVAWPYRAGDPEQRVLLGPAEVEILMARGFPPGARPVAPRASAPRAAMAPPPPMAPPTMVPMAPAPRATMAPSPPMAPPTMDPRAPAPRAAMAPPRSIAPPTVAATAPPVTSNATRGRSSSHVPTAPAVAPPMAPPSTAPAVAPPTALQQQYLERCMFLIKLLQSCADAAGEGETELVNKGLERISKLAAVDGEPIQRLASSFAHALALRLVQPWQGVCHALELSQPIPAQGASAARKYFAEMCPFLRLAAAASNADIFEAMKDEGNTAIHVVYLGGTDPQQWLFLLRILAPLRKGSPHHFRLTVVNEQDDEFRSAVAAQVTAEAEHLHVRFQLHQIKSNIDELVSVKSLGIRRGEALAVVSTLQLHGLLAYEFTDVDSHDRKGKRKAMATASSQHQTRADALLRDLRELSPKLLVIIEQEADHNGADFAGRFWSALNYYGAMFDTMEEVAPRDCPKRFCVERWLHREAIKDIVGHEGATRRERHERVERWAARMDTAGFMPVPMSPHTLLHTTELARQLPGGAEVSKRNDGCLFLHQQAIPLFSVSTWSSRVYNV